MSDPDTDPEAPEKRSLSKGEWAAVALAVLVVAGAVWVWLRKPDAGTKPQQAQAAAEPAATTPQTPAAPEVPATPVTDDEVRQALGGVSANPAFQRWLAALDDLVRRWAVVIDNLDHGESPRKVLEPLGPRAPFQVIERGGKTVIAAASYARYDEFAGAVASVDARAVAGVYRTLHPALEAAYRALGYPDGSLDAATSRALRRIEGAPVAEGAVELSPDRGLYLFADAKLEGLRQVEKHLLRMGPKNERAIQAKAAEIREALGLADVPAGK
jgi:hypothetical protein